MHKVMFHFYFIYFLTSNNEFQECGNIEKHLSNFFCSLGCECLTKINNFFSSVIICMHFTNQKHSSKENAKDKHENLFDQEQIEIILLSILELCGRMTLF